jgi:hypothetical protein
MEKRIIVKAGIFQCKVVIASRIKGPNCLRPSRTLEASPICFPMTQRIDNPQWCSVQKLVPGISAARFVPSVANERLNLLRI